MQDIYEDETYADWVNERIELALLKLTDIQEDTGENDRLQSFFRESAGWVLNALGRKKTNGFAVNAWMNPEQYSCGYDNPSAAVSCFGLEMGRLISWLSCEIRMIPQLLTLRRDDEIAAVLELFAQLYGYHALGELTVKNFRETAYWYLSDYCDIWLERHVKNCLDPGDGRQMHILSESGTVNSRWLEEQMADMPEAVIDEIAAEKAAAFLQSRDVSSPERRNVRLVFDNGNGRLAEAVKKHLEMQGFLAFACPEPLHEICRTDRRTGYSLIPERGQIREDHREDLALFLDGALCDRICKAAQAALLKSESAALAYAGALDLSLNENGIVRPIIKREAARFNDRQQKMIQKIYTAIDKAVNGIETT